MPSRLAAIIASLCATAVGVAIAYLIFAAPALFGKEDLMLLWGWVGWLPALLFAYVSGSFAYHGTRAALERRPVFAALRGAVMVRRRGSNPLAGSKMGKAIAVVLLLAVAAYLLFALAS